LQSWASHHRFLHTFPVIGVAGSNGKTIVKEWLYQLLHQQYTIVRSPKSYNSQVGVPMSLLQISEKHDLGIFEAGISEPVEMVALQNMINPTIGVFTNIGDAHASGFVSQLQKLNEKLQLFNQAEAIIFCSDQQEVRKALSDNSKRTLFSWGSYEDANLQVLNKNIGNLSSSVELRYRKITFELTIPFIDEVSIENAMHCVALMLYMGVTVEHIQESVPKLQPIEMRMFQKEGINNCLLIQDFYNSDYHSLQLALDFALRQHRGGKFTVVLSDIYQSELDDELLYRELAKLLESKNVDRLFGIGVTLQKYHWLFKNLDSQFFESTDAFLKVHRADWFENETILLKGARKFSFEKISKRLEMQLHRTTMEINLNAMANNLNYFRGKLNPSTKIMAMVKAYSYGSGTHQVASLLESKGIEFLAVAYTQEGVQLRKDGITTPILVMNPEEGNLEQLLEYKLQANIYSMKILEELLFAVGATGHIHAEIHVEFNTGMERLGFARSETKGLIQKIKEEPSLKLISVFSHLAAADEDEHRDFTVEQCREFTAIGEEFKAEFGPHVLSHILNSAGAISYSDFQLDMIRLGIGLYGIDPSSSTIELENVCSLKTYISQIREVKGSRSVGYGRKSIDTKDRRIAILPIGYADGWNRLLSNGVGHAVIHSQKAPMVGNICMDMCMVDVTDIKCKEGDPVTLFDSQDSINAIAEATGTIPYEILTSISGRVLRVFVEE
jgi:Alr-MurF fusion protein